MIPGFTRENRDRPRQMPVGADAHAMTIRRWCDETGRKAIVSSPFTRRSILGRYRIFAMKRLQQQTDASEWKKSVSGFTKNGSCQ